MSRLTFYYLHAKVSDKQIAKNAVNRASSGFDRCKDGGEEELVIGVPYAKYRDCFLRHHKI